MASLEDRIAALAEREGGMVGVSRTPLASWRWQAFYSAAPVSTTLTRYGRTADEALTALDEAMAS